MDMKRLLTLIILCISCVGVQIASAQARLIAVEAQKGALKDSVARPKALVPFTATGLQVDTVAEDSIVVDTINLQIPINSKEVKKQQRDLKRAQFVPDPQRALWLALVIPGAGQIYNRKYWKLPLVYGGFLGCTYAFTWNQQMYSDYSQAYLDIMDDNPATESYKDFLPPNFDITGREDRFKEIFKSRKNRYRRWRDLSVFCFAGVYILSVIDAYVDAQLSEFDITPDLTMRVEPTVINTNPHDSRMQQQSYGVGCSINF
jgi:hypothetical protein